MSEQLTFLFQHLFAPPTFFSFEIVGFLFYFFPSNLPLLWNKWIIFLSLQPHSLTKWMNHFFFAFPPSFFSSWKDERLFIFWTSLSSRMGELFFFFSFFPLPTTVSFGKGTQFSFSLPISLSFRIDNSFPLFQNGWISVHPPTHPPSSNNPLGSSWRVG